MNWEVLTIGQVKVMLLEAENQETYQNFRYRLKKDLRNKNFEEAANQSNKYPLAVMTYALTVTAVWHALSEGEAKDRISLEYLENGYCLKKLFWDKDRSPRDYDFKQYLAQIVPKDRGTDYDRAIRCLERIKRVYTEEEFRPEMTLNELLDWIAKENEKVYIDCKNNRAPFEEWPIASSIQLLKEFLSGWFQQIQETDLPGQPEPCAPAAPASPAAQLNLTFAKDVCGLLENGVKQFILTGAPGTGKTYAAKQLAQYLGDPLPGTRGERAYTMVQFHPSYDYTDFVEGLRPVQTGSQVQFAKLDGTFKAFCRQAAKHGTPSGRYFFLIDEINRAELSKVFGELMYCLDADKRGPENRVQTQYQNLKTYDLEREQYLNWEEDIFSDGFYIPENVYIIGTMNDIDRSVESMDFALRRRFNLQEVVVDQELLHSAFSAMGFGGNVEGLTNHVVRLNQAVEDGGAAYGLNRQFFIAQGHFAGLPQSLPKTGPLNEILDYVWSYRLETLLREYLRGVNEDRVNKFVERCKTAFLDEGEHE